MFILYIWIFHWLYSKFCNYGKWSISHSGSYLSTSLYRPSSSLNHFPMVFHLVIFSHIFIYIKEKYKGPVIFGHLARLCYSACPSLLFYSQLCLQIIIHTVFLSSFPQRVNPFTSSRSLEVAIIVEYFRSPMLPQQNYSPYWQSTPVTLCSGLPLYQHINLVTYYNT